MTWIPHSKITQSDEGMEERQRPRGPPGHARQALLKRNPDDLQSVWHGLPVRVASFAILTAIASQPRPPMATWTSSTPHPICAHILGPRTLHELPSQRDRSRTHPRTTPTPPDPALFITTPPNPPTSPQPPKGDPLSAPILPYPHPYPTQPHTIPHNPHIPSENVHIPPPS